MLLSVFFTLAEDERCIPFVYIITSSEAVPVISYCLNKFKQFYSGHFFEIKVFMSDMARNFNNAIIEVFGQSHIWLWYAYHFFNNFNKNLIEKVKDKESRKILGEDFYKLTIIMDIPTFNSALNIFCNKLKRINLSFFNYFHNIFVKNTREWTMAFRWLSRLNTNCFAEGAFSSLKVRFLKKRIIDWRTC